VSRKQRVDQQSVFVLHSYPWRETSLIVEVLSRDHGRVPLVAKGARRPYSTLRGVLMGFQPLLADWSGGGEVKTLIRAEWQGGQPLLTGRPLLCGYYLNELIMRLTAREDPHPELFDVYAHALSELADGRMPAIVLRRFELALMRHLGYALELEREGDSGKPLRPDVEYIYRAEGGPVPADKGAGAGDLISGATLLDMARDCFDSPRTQAQSKVLLRWLISRHLGDKPLQSRRVLKELQEL